MLHYDSGVDRHRSGGTGMMCKRGACRITGQPTPSFGLTRNEFTLINHLRAMNVALLPLRYRASTAAALTGSSVTSLKPTWCNASRTATRFG